MAVAHDQEKASPRTEARARGQKTASKFEGECRYCQKREHKEVDCRKMKSDIAAGKCE